LLVDPGEELFDDRLGVHQSIVELPGGTELLCADALFHRVEPADEVQSPRRRLRLDVLRLEQFASRVRPALRVGQPGLLRVVLIGGVAVGEQDTALDRRQAQRLLDMLYPATLEEGEADFVQFAIDRPEVRGLQFPRSGASGLDRRLVHGLDARGADRCELRIVDRFEQRDALLPDLGQPWPTDGDAAIGEALVLAIERQVVGKLVDQEAGNETDVGAAALNDSHRCGWADDDLRRLDLDHRPPVVEHHIAARTLGEPIAVLVADDLELFRRESFGFGCREFDDFDRNPRIVEEGQAVVAGIRLLRCLTPRVGRDWALGGRRR